MDIQEAVNRLHLDLLPEDWVKTVWENDFITLQELPDDYELRADESTDYSECMQEVAASIRSWLNNESILVDQTKEDANFDDVNPENIPKKSWQVLLTVIDHKALLCFIASFLREDARNENLDSMLKALSAAKLYFSLLCVNGAHVYKVFNESLYTEALETFKIGNALCSEAEKPQNKTGKKKNSKEVEECVDTTELLQLSSRDRRQLLEALSFVVDEVHSMLGAFHLKNNTDSLEVTIQSLLLLTRFERSSSQFLEHCPQSTSLTYLAHKGYKMLMELCTSDHGEPEKTVRLMMKALLPYLGYSDKPLGVSDREQSVIRDHSMKFINHMANLYSSVSLSGIESLLQQMSTNIPDKADIRTRCIGHIIDLLIPLPNSVYTSFVTWVVGLCHSDKVRYRVTGVELMTKLLAMEERFTDNSSCPSTLRMSSSGSQDQNRDLDMSSHAFLFATIISRCRDISPTVRAKSLSAFSSMISSKSFGTQYMMESIFINDYANVEVIEPSFRDRQIFDFKSHVHWSRDNLYPTRVDPLPSGTVIVKLLEKLVDDDKVFVRKNALHALCNICNLNIKWATEKRLLLLVTGCKDTSVAVRKMLIQSMTELLLNYPVHEILAKSWVEGIIPLIGDNEIKSQEKVLDAIDSVILGNIVQYKETCDVLHSLPWKILNLISSFGYRQLFRFACKHWTTNNRIKPKLFNIIQSHIQTENNLAAWFFLVCLSEFENIPNANFVLNYYYTNVHDGPTEDEYCSQLVLEAVCLNWMELEKKQQEELCSKLKKSLETFSVPLPLITRSLEICQHLDSANIKAWGEQLIRSCERYLKKRISAGCNRKVPNEQVLSQYVFTLGELVHFCPGVLHKSTIALLAKVIDPEYEDDNKSKKWEGTVNDCVKAVIIATLGKFALQGQLVAKSLVASFGNLLSSKWESKVKINAIVALSDLCVRFTGLIESYLGDMFVCLRDPDLVMRKYTLTMLIQLIQEDYLKLRCPFIFYILMMLEDETSSIREQTSAFLVNTVLSKNPSIMYQHFIQSVFFYNNYEGPASNNQVVMSPQERAAFCIPGDSRRDCRHRLYRYMLEHMQDDHKFKVTYRLCIEVLGEVCEGKIQLDEVGTFVLRDALYILGCDEIRITHVRGGKEAHEDDNGEVVEEVITHLRNSIISQIVKKNYVENIVPIIIRLKQKLKEMKSPLVRDVMICLRGLMKDFKEEINEILGDDPELASEVAHDLRMMQQEEEASPPRDEESERQAHIKSLMKEVRIECVRLSEEVLLRGSVDLSCPPEGLELDLAGIMFTPSRSKNPPSVPPQSAVRPSPPRTPQQQPPLNTSSSSTASSSSSVTTRKRTRQNSSNR